MEKSTETEQGVNEHSYTNVEETHKENYSQIVVNELIEGTPFRIINQNEKWFLVSGNSRITEPTMNRESTMAKLENEKWLIIMHLAVLIAEKLIENEKNKGAE